MAKRVHVIINPAAGQNEAILNTLNRVFNGHIKWDVDITRKAGHAYKRAKKALKKGVDVVAAYGGDGTVVEVAAALEGSDVPLAILPGGTANAFAQEMHIPTRLPDAASLITNPESQVRTVDVGHINDQPFMVGAGTGIVAEMIKSTVREQKNRLGYFAYSLATLQAFIDPPSVKYHVKLDDEEFTIEAAACYIANIGNFGIAGVSLLKTVKANDGLLDVVFFRKVDIPELTAFAAGMAEASGIVAVEDFPARLPHWQSRRIELVADPPQDVIFDGEIYGQTPVTLEVKPDALKVITPPPKKTTGRLFAPASQRT